MKVPVVWTSFREACPNRHFWDDEIIESLISGSYWRPSRWPEFEHIEYPADDLPKPYENRGAIFVLPARHHADPIWADRLNEEINLLPWAIVMLIGDEESSFPSHLIRHPRMKLWTMMCRLDQHADVRLPNGPAPHIHLLDDTPVPVKHFDWAFLGQVTHSRREQCVATLRDLPSGVLVESQGFTQGISPEEYVRVMASAKIAPCPSGPQAPDSFRFAEALELGCLPAADATAPVPYPPGYWTSVFGQDIPFPVVLNWNTLPELIREESSPDLWPMNVNLIGAWWIGQRRRFAYLLRDQIAELSGERVDPDPQPYVIGAAGDADGTQFAIEKLRFDHPNCGIVLTIPRDNRPEAQEITRDMIWRCLRWKSWQNVLPILE